MIKGQRERYLQEIEKGITYIREVVELKIDPDDIEAVIEHGFELKSLQATAARYEAWSKAIRASAMADLLHEYKETYPDAKQTELKMLVEAEVYREGLLLDLSTRLGRSLSHSLDFIRSVISLRKEEMNQQMRDVQ